MSKNSFTYQCPKCRDRGHVPTPGGVVRCDCLRSEINKRAFISAGIPAAVASLSVDDILKSLPAALVKFLTETRSGDLWVIAPRTSPSLEFVIAYGLTVRADQSASGTSLSKVIDSRFDRDLKGPVDAMVASSSTLVFRIDDVGDHKKIPSVMEEVVGVRSANRSSTIYVSDASIVKHTGRYGIHVCRFFSEFGRGVTLKSGLTVRYRPF